MRKTEPQRLADETGLEVSFDLIAATTTRTGLKVFARLDERVYPRSIKISDADLAAAQLESDPFHPE